MRVSGYSFHDGGLCRLDVGCVFRWIGHDCCLDRGFGIIVFRSCYFGEEAKKVKSRCGTWKSIRREWNNSSSVCLRLHVCVYMWSMLWSSLRPAIMLHIGHWIFHCFVLFLFVLSAESKRRPTVWLNWNFLSGDLYVWHCLLELAIFPPRTVWFSQLFTFVQIYELQAERMTRFSWFN